METLTIKQNDSEENQDNDTVETNTEREVNPEVRKFSKRYSLEGRKKAAEEILAIRSEFFEKEKGNKDRFDSIKNSEAELLLLQERLRNIEDEIKNLEDQLQVRNSQLWSKITDWFRKEELAEELGIRENLQKLEDVKKQIEERYTLINQAESTILDTAKLDEAKERLKQFYGEQNKLKGIYESEDQERDVTEILKRDKLIFLHGLPTLERPMNETSENNTVVNTRGLSTETKLDLLVGLEPTISTSVIKEGDETSKTFYPFGVILNKGKILSAYKEDAGTITEGMYSRRSKYDKQTQRTSIQKNSAEKLKEAVNVNPQERNWGGHNEIAIERPGIAGLYVNLSNTDGYKPISIAELKKYSEELNLPVYALYKGKLYPFNVEDKYTTRLNGRIVENEKAFEVTVNPIDPSDIVNDKKEITPEEKLECVQKAIEQFPFVISSRDKKLVGAYQNGSDSVYSGLAGYDKFIADGKLHKEQKEVGFAMIADPGTLSNYLKQYKDSLSDWKQRAEGTHPDYAEKSTPNSRKVRNYARQKMEADIFGLYGFAKKAEEREDTTTAKEAMSIIQEFYPISKCEELLQKRIDSDGQFKILEEDIPVEVRRHIKELKVEKNIL